MAARATDVQHAKLEQIVHDDFTDYSGIGERLTGFDACFYCLGVSSLGMSEESYRYVTYDFTLAAAEALLADNQGLVFCYVSGAGADSSEQGRSMWARVRGKTENDLLKLPFARGLHFSSRVCPCGQGRRAAVAVAPRVVLLHAAALSPPSGAASATCDHGRELRPGHAERCAARLCVVNPGKRRHQRCRWRRVPVRGAGRIAALGMVVVARQRPSASWTIVGRLSISASSTRAGPSGRRRPCSQFLSVPSGMPMHRAKAGCDIPVLLRIATTSGTGTSI